MKAHCRNRDAAQAYIKNVKILFPIVRRQERTYLRQMKQNIEDYCADNHVSSPEELYQEFGSPQETVCNYYSMIDIVPLMKQILLRRIAKYFLIFISVLLFSFTVFFCTLCYQENLALQRMNILFEDDV